MLKYTVSLYTSIPFGLKALYRNIIIPQNENERERNTDIRLIKHLNGHLPNAHNTNTNDKNREKSIAVVVPNVTVG